MSMPSDTKVLVVTKKLAGKVYLYSFNRGEKVDEELTAVTLSMVSVNEVISRLFSQLPPRLTYLKINLNSSQLYEDKDPLVVNAKLQLAFDNLFARCQELVELDLSYCFHGSKQPDIGALLRHAPASMRRLNLSNLSLGENDISRFMGQIPPSVTELDISNNLIGFSRKLSCGKILEKLMQAVPPDLQFLDLSNDSIQNISINILGAILRADNLNPAMRLKLFPGSMETIADLRMLTAGLLEKGLGDISYKNALQGLEQENKLIELLQEVPQRAQFIDLSKISLDKINIVKLSQMLSESHVKKTTRIKLLPNKTVTISELAHFVKSLNATDKIKSYKEQITPPFAAISWDDTGALQIDFDNAGHCEQFSNEFTAREKQSVVPEPFRHSLAYTDNPEGLVFRNPEPNTLLLTPYKPPSSQEGIDHISVNFTTPGCRETFLEKLFHIKKPPVGVTSTYYIDKTDHKLKRVDFDLFNDVEGHKREDVLFELVVNRPDTIFWNSAHPLFQQGFVLELKQSFQPEQPNQPSNELTLEVVNGHIQRFDYQDRLRQLLPTEEAFEEHRLLEMWAGKFGNSIVASHYEQERVDLKGLWLLIKDTVSDAQFEAARMHPQTRKYVLNKEKEMSFLKFFSSSAEVQQHVNWIFVPETYLQSLKVRDPRFGTLWMCDWVDMRLPDIAKKAKSPDLKQITVPIVDDWEIVDDDTLPPTQPPPSSSGT